MSGTVSVGSLGSGRRTGRDRTGGVAAAGVLVALVVLLILSLLPTAGLSPARGPAGAAPRAAVSPGARAAPVPASAQDNLTCFKITATICVSVQLGSPNIIPSPGNLTSSYEPNASDTIALWVKSQTVLTWFNAPTANNQHVPIRVNVSGVLWNGDPWMNRFDGTVWHANGGQPWFVPAAPGTVHNMTYPYWYAVYIRNVSQNGVPNFYPGEYVDWNIYIVQNNSGVYSYILSPPFHYRLAGAWAFSPYAGARQFAGPNAALLDLYIRQNPLAPNWNDPVTITIEVTQSDVVQRATIGAAWLLVNASSPTGAPLPNATLQYPTPVSGLNGVLMSAVTIPAGYAVVAGTTINYRIVAHDNSRTDTHEIVTPVLSYTVGANGTFVSGLFQNDLLVNTTPPSVAATGSGFPCPVLAQGTNVSILLTSQQPGTSLLSAEVTYTFGYAPLHEVQYGSILFNRVNSTNLRSQLSGLPIGATMSFQILVWDYANDLEVSPVYCYSTSTFLDNVPSMPPNLAFVWVYVYDNGSSSWVTGANVSFQTPGSYVNSVDRSTFGIAYPNATGQPFTPLLLPANVSYVVTIADPRFIPASGPLSGPVQFTLRLTNPMTAQQQVVQTSTYTVVQSGPSVYVWLNSTPPGTTFSGSPPFNGAALVPAIGLAGGLVALGPVLLWWREIQRRRKEQEKRVTL